MTYTDGRGFPITRLTNFISLLTTQVCLVLTIMADAVTTAMTLGPVERAAVTLGTAWNLTGEHVEVSS